MSSYNKTLLMGNIARDPELRVTPKGAGICQFSVAINHKYKTESGEVREEVTFVDCEAWNKTAENIAKYFTKGKPIFLDGRLKMDSWEDKTTGQKRSKLKVVVDSFQFVGGKEPATDSAAGPGPVASRTPEPARAPVSRPKPHFDNIDEDVPF